MPKQRFCHEEVKTNEIWYLIMVWNDTDASGRTFRTNGWGFLSFSVAHTIVEWDLIAHLVPIYQAVFQTLSQNTSFNMCILMQLPNAFGEYDETPEQMQTLSY
jgi:5-methyltetrahydrofolate--homocysteine methyltransferase